MERYSRAGNQKDNIRKRSMENADEIAQEMGFKLGVKEKESQRGGRKVRIMAQGSQ